MTDPTPTPISFDDLINGGGASTPTTGTGTTATVPHAKAYTIYGLSPNAAAQLLVQNGFVGTGEGEGPTSVWYDPQNPGQRYTAEQLVAALRRQSAGTAARGGSTGGSGANLAIQQADLAIRQQNQAFLERKAAFEETTGLAKDAAQTRAQLIQVRTQIAAQQADIAANIGRLAANPGDIGEQAAYSLAASGQGFGQEASGLTGQDFRSNNSLQPLQSLLDQRQSLFGLTKNVDAAQQQADADYQNARSQLGSLLPAGAGAVTPAVAPQPAPVASQSAPTGQPAVVPGPYDPISILAAALGAQPGADTTPNVKTGIDLSGAIQGALPTAHGGGMESGAYISGERGPEINIPTKDGGAVVLNKDQAKVLGINLDKLVKMAEGGILAPSKPPDDVSGARDFLGAALTRALASTGQSWNQRTLPGPVFASAPGTSTLVRQLLASLNSLGRGINPQYFEEQTQRLQPAGVNEYAVRRTA